MENENETMDKSEWFFPHNLTKIEGRPPIYSQNRQELCEALPYFRSYQSGCYASDQRATGYLLDGFPAPRDVFEDFGRVIISHAGGGSIISRPEGSKAPQLTLVRSQNRESAPVRALLKCKHECVPVALIAGVKYAGMPWMRKYPSVRYAVLGHYLVTHSWPELESIGDHSNVRRFRFKFRFQWVSSQGDPWWLSDMEEHFKSMKPQWANACGRLLPSLSDDKRHEAAGKIDGESSSINRIHSSDHDMMELSDEDPVTCKCNACGRDSLNIYKGCWMCLNETCMNFFQTNESNGPSPNEEKMHYVWWFLKHQQCLETETRVPFSLTPKTLQKLHGTQLEFAANQEPKTGFYCSSCGRLSIRIYWGSLVCSNEECQFAVDLSVTSLPCPSDFTSNYRNMNSTSYDSCSLNTILEFKISGYWVRWYKFLDNSCGVIHATPSSGRYKSFADYLFREFQTGLGPLSLRRSKMKTSRIGTTVAQAFTLNCGQKYKYCAEVETKSWHQAPLPVVQAYSVICKFVRLLNDEVLENPNQLGLGVLPQNFNELLSCFYLPGTGMKYHSDDESGLGSVVGSISLGSTAIMGFKRKESVTPSGEIITKGIRPMLQLVIRHGEIVLQCGSNLQRNYKHSIKTDGMRISTTARYIDPKVMR